MLGLLARAPATIERAARAGWTADRLGPAFLEGYRAAVDAAVPGLAGPRAALAATESGRLHPAAITTRMVDGRVTGHKRWVTGATDCERLVVLARTDDGSGERADLVVAVVATDAPGVTLRPSPPTPFVPEVAHAEVVLEGAPVLGEVADGWATVVRPFRTVEDIHVLAAVHAYLLGAARRQGFERTAVEDLLAGLATLMCLADAAPADPSVHLALAGLLRSLTRTVAGLSWAGEEGERWVRDVVLLGVAQGARQARSDAAWGRWP
ncbi:MAG: acyl-CoA dehydrogenase family protein [Alphaproteobacteria bacterium]|nr:acyl-CoA dehydrogenase family protein [Alphaproteobacteria bacterium]